MNQRAPINWEPREYPGDLAQLRRVRADLAADLRGFDGDLLETVALCVSELFANCVKYTDSGRPDGEVLRFLSMPAPHTLRLALSDGGGSGALPRIPEERSSDEWDWAEGQRGLLLVQNLAAAWGHYPLAPWADLGTHVWADFTVESAPPLLPYVFAA